MRGAAVPQSVCERAEKGDLIFVKTGERLPADGIIKQGKTSIDEQLITGNMLPTSKTAGSRVYAGTLNKSDAVYIEVTEVLASSALMSVVDAIKKGKSTAAVLKARWTALPPGCCPCCCWPPGARMRICFTSTARRSGFIIWGCFYSCSRCAARPPWCLRRCFRLSLRVRARGRGKLKSKICTRWTKSCTPIPYF